MKPTYDTTIARMAGNIAAGIVSAFQRDAGELTEAEVEYVADVSVEIAAAIVAEVKRRPSLNGKIG